MSGEISYRVTVGEHAFDVTLFLDKDQLVARVGDQTIRVAWQARDRHRGVLTIDERKSEVLLAESTEATLLAVDGYQAEAQLVEARALRLAASLPRRAGHAERIELRAPMPGRVVSVRVSVGEAVERNALLAILEAMKMENELRAPAPGRVTDVRVAEGDTVEHGALLVRLEQPGGE